MTTPMERLKEKITKEVLWMYILRLLKDRPMYAYELKNKIRESFGFEPATVSSYVVLYKLEHDGYVTFNGTYYLSLKLFSCRNILAFITFKHFVISESGHKSI